MKWPKARIESNEVFACIFKLSTDGSTNCTTRGPPQPALLVIVTANGFSQVNEMQFRSPWPN